MRIVGGQFKGHRFSPPKNTPARPTTDIAKEGLFNILANNISFEDTVALDLFGGTGSISYELASRGCESICLVERDRSNIQFIHKMNEKLGIKMEVHQQDVFRFINSCSRQFTFIFAGPPYPLKTLATIPDLVFENSLLHKDGLFVMEHNPNHNFKEHPNYLTERNYGSTIFAIFDIK